MKPSILFSKIKLKTFSCNSLKVLSRRNFCTISQKKPEVKKDRTIGEYTVFDHEYDAIVLGAGGAGLRVNLNNFRPLLD